MQPANGLETFIEVSWGLHHNCVGTAVVEIEAKCTAGEGYDEDLPTQVNRVVKHGCYRETRCGASPAGPWPGVNVTRSSSCGVLCPQQCGRKTH